MQSFGFEDSKSEKPDAADAVRGFFILVSVG